MYIVADYLFLRAIKKLNSYLDNDITGTWFYVILQSVIFLFVLTVAV